MTKEEFAEVIQFTDVYIEKIRPLSFFERLKHKFLYEITLTGTTEDNRPVRHQKYLVHRICFEDTCKVIINREIQGIYHDFKNNIYAINVTARITIYPDRKYSVVLFERKGGHQSGRRRQT